MEYCVNFTPYFDSFIRHVEWAELMHRSLTGVVLDECKSMKIELQFLKTFFKCVVRDQFLRDASASSISNVLCESCHSITESYGLIGEIKKVRRKVSSALRRIRETRQNTICLYEQISVSSKSYNPMTEDLVLEIIDELMQNLDYLLSSESNLVVSLKRQIQVLKKELSFLRDFLVLAALRCSEHGTFKDLLAHVEAMTIDVARMSYSCFSKERNGGTSLEMDLELSNLLRKLKPTNPDVREMYVRVLNASKIFESSKTCYIKYKHLFGAFIDSLQENLFEILNSESGCKHPLQDQLLSLGDELRFLRSILMNPPEEYIDSENMNDLLGNSDSVIIESACLIFSLHAYEIRGETAIEKNILLVGLRARMQSIKEETRKIYLKVPKSLPSKISRTFGLGFIKSFLENLKEMLCHGDNSIAFPKRHVKTVQKDFEFLYSLLSKLEKQLDQQEELKCIWARVIEVAYHAEYVVDSFVVKDSPVWYYMLCLDDIMEVIQVLKADVAKLFEEMRYDTKVRTSMKPSGSAFISSAHSPILDDRVVGFEDEEEKVMQLLVRGSGAKLDTVSIVGMPGIGKTTLCKKIYNSELVGKHFHVCSWCCVSQVYQKKHLFLSILSHIIPLSDEIKHLDEDDLAQVLYKNLKGRRYLIVMDDIWNIQAWHDFRMSFPDDENGSRIMFTSRLLDVVSQAKLHSNPFSLRPLKDEECWELLQHLIFSKKTCPLELRDIGKQIAKGCKGVPLSVVLVAGLLMPKKTEDSWTKIAQSLTSRLFKDPQSHCMDIVGNSYNDLPDHLKPCFLYFRVFLEDQDIPVDNLIWLWSGEGFVRKVEGKSTDITAEDYLKDLISRNLVTVSRFATSGGVKACRLHDLLYYFCKEKSEEENFCQLIGSDHDACNLSYPIAQTYEAQRLCIYISDKDGPDFEGCPIFKTKEKNSGLHSHVRSILFRGSERRIFRDTSFNANSFKLLRVLDLRKLHLLDYPTGLELLIYLKFLAIDAYSAEIPESVANLMNLETLLLSSSQRTFATTIFKSKTLRHLHAKGLIMFLSDHRKRVSPRLLHLDQQRCSSLEVSDKLHSLETISNLSLLPGEDEEIFRKIPNIRRLHCIVEESLLEDIALFSPFDNAISYFPEIDLLKKLESLHLDCNVFFPRFMKKKPPGKFSFPSTLKKLTLQNYYVQQNEISIIGRLGNLEVFKLVRCSFDGDRWDMIDGEFPKLRVLKLENVDLKEWNASDDHFPCLQRLTLKSCSYLNEIPFCLGSIPSLEMVEVKWCFELDLESVHQIRQEQESMGNDGFKVLITEPNWT